MDIFGVLNVLPRLWEEQSELFLSRLKQAERAVHGAVDNLNVLHSGILTEMPVLWQGRALPPLLASPPGGGEE